VIAIRSETAAGVGSVKRLHFYKQVAISGSKIEVGTHYKNSCSFCPERAIKGVCENGGSGKEKRQVSPGRRYPNGKPSTGPPDVIGEARNI